MAHRITALLLSTALVCGITGGTASAAGYGLTAIDRAAGYAAVSSAAEQDAYLIVGLGDSITAGYEFGMDQQANPVPYGYVDRMYEQALFHGRAEVANYGILGLKVGGLQRLLSAVEKNEPVTVEEVEPDKVYPRAKETVAASPQIREHLQKADLAVITIGANDLSGAIELIKNKTKSREETDAWLDDTLNRYDAALDASLRSILAIQPGIEIVVADQYSPVPDVPLFLRTAGLQEADYTYLWECAGKLRDKLNQAAARLTGEGYKVKVAYAAESFKGQEQKLTSIIAGRGDLHPNQKGYSLLGEAFAKAVWGEYATVAPRPADVPMSVVVNGKEVVSPFKTVVKAGRSYLVLRDIAGAMKAGTKWDGKAQTATVALNGRTVALKIGAKAMTVDGQSVAIDSPAFLLKSGKEMKTYVPLSVLADGLGFQVVYRSSLKTAFINR
jgi:lysophospholipase L1-like esterase